MLSHQSDLQPEDRVRHVRTDECGRLLDVTGRRRKTAHVEWDRASEWARPITGYGWLEDLRPEHE